MEWWYIPVLFVAIGYSYMTYDDWFGDNTDFRGIFAFSVTIISSLIFLACYIIINGI